MAYLSFSLKFHEDLVKQNCKRFLIEILLKGKRQIKIFTFNICTNLMESQDFPFLIDLLQRIFLIKSH